MTDELAGAVARGVRDALIAAHHATVDNHHEKADAARTDFMERMERELADLWSRVGPIDFTDPTLPEDIRQAFGSLSNPTHQADFFFNLLTAVGVALSGSFAAAAGWNQQLTERGLFLKADVRPSVDVLAAVARRKGATSASDTSRTSPNLLNPGAPAGLNGANASKLAAYQGVHKDSFEWYMEAARPLLDVSSLIQLVRLGKIDINQFHDAIIEWGYDETEQFRLNELIYQQPSAATAIAAEVQGHLTTDQVLPILRANGIATANHDWLFETAGRPPAIGELTQLLNRNIIDEATLRQAVRESDIKTKYIDQIIAMRYHPPPMRSIVSMLRKGAIAQDVAIKWLGYVGLLPEAVDAVVKEAMSSGSVATHDLSPSKIEQLYKVGKFDRATALTHLQTLGFDALNSGLLIDLVDLEKGHASQAKAANAIGTRYVGWKIDRNAASQALDALAVAPAERDELLADWDEIRETRTAHLTRADIHKAVNATKMTPAEGIARLRAMGYDQADADLIPFIDKWAV